MDPIFPIVPADLSALSADELDALLVAHKEVAARLSLASKAEATDEQREVFGGHGPESVVEQFTQAAVDTKRIEAQIAELNAGAEAFATAVAEQAAAMGVVSEETEPEPVDGDDTPSDPEAVVAAGEEEVEVEAAEVVAEAEAVVAAAAAEETPKAARLRLPAASRRHTPVAVGQSQGNALVAAAGIEGVRGGQPLDEKGLVHALINARKQFTAAPPGFSEKAVVASAEFNLPVERRLSGDNFGDDWEKIQAVVGRDAVGITYDGQEAMVAAGGLCAPVSNYYGLANVSTTLRPVRDALVGFQAVRGGINVAAVPTLAAVTTGVGYKTEAQDAAGGTFALKTCQSVDCPAFSEVDVNIVYHCLKFGNLQARTFPEQVAQFTDLTMAAHARLAEGLLLTQIGALSTAVTSAAVNGAVNSMLGVILQTAAGMRSRHRMTPGVTLRALFPEWIKDLLVLDLIRGQFDRFERNQAGVVALLREFGIEPSFYLDSATGKGQVFGAQSAGAFLEFPDTAVWYLFPEGSFLFLDGGTLELGIVRDSTLNAENQFTVFGETFENAAFIGVESLQVTSTICPNGAVALPGTATTC